MDPQVSSAVVFEGESLLKTHAHAGDFVERPVIDALGRATTECHDEEQ
jgi:hypothetical protein